MSNQETVYYYEPLKFVESYHHFRNELLELDFASTSEQINVNHSIYIKSLNRQNITVASIQMKSLPSFLNTTSDLAADARIFLQRAANYVMKASVQYNASLVLLQELFLGPYFCQNQDAQFFSLAETLSTNNPIIQYMSYLARRYSVVLPISIFERKNNAYYNSVLVVDSDGSTIGMYRKSHIPDGHGYQEKYYFTPGDTGFEVFHTSIGAVGVGICWDQWFPESARIMALQGADILLYPTAIGSEPQNDFHFSLDHWRHAIQGHAAANMIPIIVSNRYGTEILRNVIGNKIQKIHFYGRSFITDNTGKIVKEAKDGVFDIISYNFNFNEYLSNRITWGLFRDRRTDLYQMLKTKDGLIDKRSRTV